MSNNLKIYSIFILLLIVSNDCKKIDRYDLAIELYRNGMTKITSWICVIGVTSGYNIDQGTGLFGFSSDHWCTWGEKGKGCNMDCNQFIDDDLVDDIWCAKLLYSTNGFKHWGTEIPKFCNNLTVNSCNSSVSI